MKRIVKLISVLLLLLSITVVCAITVSAEDTPFNDVQEEDWFSTAVAETYGEGVFLGTSENTFSPNEAMTREMFVCVLARLCDADLSGYTDVSFSDVEPGSWYAPSVEWAYRNGITSGIGDDLFGVGKEITREEVVTIYYNYAEFCGRDVTVSENAAFKYENLSDEDEIAEWAKEAFRWAIANRIITGVGNDSTKTVSSPKTVATRAQNAMATANYLTYSDSKNGFPLTEQTIIGEVGSPTAQKAAEGYPVASFKINGNPVSDYVIVYSQNCEKKDTPTVAAKLVRDLIEEATGIKLDVVTDATAKQNREILIGKTNREGGDITLARNGQNKQWFEVKCIGDTLIIAGDSDEKNYEGTKYAAYGFAEEMLGFSFYSGKEDYEDKNSDYVHTIDRADEINVPNGYSFVDGPRLEYRVSYWPEYVGDSLRGGDASSISGHVHNIGELTETGADSDEMPCLSDENILAVAIKNIEAAFVSKPTATGIWVSQNDISKFCRCEKCMQAYKEEGSNAGALIRFLNKIAAQLEKDGYGDKELWTLAYQYTTVPTKTHPDDSVVVFYCTIFNCASHTYSDPTCSLNASICQNMVGWGKICKKVYVWDYSTNFKYGVSAFPISTWLYENFQFLYANGMRGMFNNAVEDKTAEFGVLYSYLIAKLEWNPLISEEEYNNMINDFLKAYYGPGWQYIRRYIDVTEYLSDKRHFCFDGVCESILSYDEILEYEAEFDECWDAAEAAAENATQVERIRTARLAWTYMKLNAEFTVTGATSQYQEDAKAFYEEGVKYKIRWAEGGEINFDEKRPPILWYK